MENERLRLWEDQPEAREQRTGLASKLASRATVATPKVGRNDMPLRVGSQIQATPRRMRLQLANRRQ